MPTTNERGPAAQALIGKAMDLDRENKALKCRLRLRDDLYGALADYFRDENMPDSTLLDRIHTALARQD